MSRHMLYVLSAWRFTCCRRVRAFTLVVVVGVEWLVVDDFAGLGEDGDRVAVDDHHPRACGANNPWILHHEFLDGSSPRMRGKQTALAEHVGVCRIIPAHAGQTTCRVRPAHGRASIADHPRACGANYCSILFFAALYGSSPRMRGKRASCPRNHRSRRINPLFFICQIAAPDMNPRTCRALVKYHINPGSLPQLQDTVSITGRPSLQQTT